MAPDISSTVMAFSSFFEIWVSILISSESVTSLDAWTEFWFLILAISSSDMKRVAKNLPALDSMAELTKRFLAVTDGPNSRISTTPVKNRITIARNVQRQTAILPMIFPTLLSFLSDRLLSLTEPDTSSKDISSVPESASSDIISDILFFILFWKSSM